MISRRLPDSRRSWAFERKKPRPEGRFRGNERKLRCCMSLVSRPNGRRTTIEKHQKKWAEEGRKRAEKEKEISAYESSGFLVKTVIDWFLDFQTDEWLERCRSLLLPRSPPTSSSPANSYRTKEGSIVPWTVIEEMPLNRLQSVVNHRLPPHGNIVLGVGDIS